MITINESYINSLDLESIDLLYKNLSNQLLLAKESKNNFESLIKNQTDNLDIEKVNFDILVETEIIEETIKNMECIENCLNKILKK